MTVAETQLPHPLILNLLKDGQRRREMQDGTEWAGGPSYNQFRMNGMGRPVQAADKEMGRPKPPPPYSNLVTFTTAKVRTQYSPVM